MGVPEPLVPMRLPGRGRPGQIGRMPAASSTISNYVATDDLAVGGPGMVRSRLLMNVPFETVAQREHAKEKFYVICQSFGWTLFVGVQLAFLPLFGSGESNRNATLSAAR